MPLQQQTQAFPLYGGIDTKTDPKYVPVTSTLVSENLRFPANQQVTKRYGQTLLPSSNAGVSSPLTSGKALGAFGNELLAYDGKNLKAYASAQSSWVQRAVLTETEVLRAPIIRSAGSVESQVSTLAGNDEVYAWHDSIQGGVWYAVRDSISGTFVVSPTLLDATGTTPRLVTLAQNIVLTYLSGGTLFARTIPFYQPAAGASGAIVIAIGVTAGAAYTTAVDGVQLYLFLNVGTYQFWVLSSTLVILTTTVMSTQPVSSTWADMVFPTSGAFGSLVVFDTVAGILYNFSVPKAGGDPAPTSGATGIAGGKHCAVYADSATTTRVLYDEFYTTSMPATVAYSFDPQVGSLGPFIGTYGVVLASGAALYNSVGYVVLASAVINQNWQQSQQEFFLLSRADTLAPLLRFSEGSAVVSGDSFATPLVDGTNIFFSTAERTALRVSAVGAIYSVNGLTSARFSFPAVSKLRITPFGNTALINCGNVYTYDGSKVVESGFWEFPDGITAMNTPAASGLSAGLYTYIAVYQWTDAAGNTHYSTPSYPSPVGGPSSFGITVLAGDSVTLQIPYTALTLKTDAVIALYRTLVDTQGPYYLLVTTPNKTDGTPSIAYTDTASDVSIQGQPFLYAPPDGSGELENNAPPPAFLITATKTRIFLIAEDDRTALWYSKPLTPGRPAEFSAEQVLRVETDGGAVAALGAIDSQAILFKTGRTYYVPGDGPNAAGQPANGFPATPVLISGTSGCTNQASVLSTHEGVFFKSLTGIQLLNRSLSTNYQIGLPVQGFNSLSLTGAQIVSAQNQLRWTSSEGTALVFDYVLGRWSTYTNYAAVGYAPYGSTFARLTTGGDVFYEDTSLFTDNLQPVTMTVETCWFKSAGTAQGYAAVWYAEILGDFVSNHSLQIQVYYDYLPISSQTALWNAAGNQDLYGADTPYGITKYYGSNVLLFTAPYQPRLALQRQVCEAVKFRISDVSQSGASCNLNEIALQLGVIGGLNRVPVGQQV